MSDERRLAEVRQDVVATTDIAAAGFHLRAHFRRASLGL
jgi:hypothetical protein